MPDASHFLSLAYLDLGLDARYSNCDVAPAALADAVRSAPQNSPRW